jgi:hypothetical protein
MNISSCLGDFVSPCVATGGGMPDRVGGGQGGPNDGVVNDDVSTHYCLVAIGRLQVTSTPNTNDLAGSSSNNGEPSYIYSIKSLPIVRSFDS